MTFTNQNINRMKVLKIIGIALLVLIVLIFAVSAFLPSKVKVERQISIKADRMLVYDQVNILKNWGNWSPWHRIDSAIVLTFSGPESGKGAAFAWSSKHKQVGNGKLTTLSTTPSDTIKMEVDFGENGKMEADFIFVQSADSVIVTWEMDMDLGWNPIAKFFGLAMDKIIGPDFERGLRDLKTLTESAPHSSEMKIEQVSIQSQKYLFKHVTCPASEIGKELASAYTEIGELMQKNSLQLSKSPFAMYYEYQPTKFVFDACIFVDKDVKTAGNVKLSEMKAGNAVVAHYYGAYEKTGGVYQIVTKWLKDNNKKSNGAAWEEYVTDPRAEKDTAKWLTKIYFPIE